MSRCYRHIAPLERKAPMHQNSRDGIHRRGGVASPDGLGQPTPTGSRVCDNTILRSSGARGLDVSRCYRHIAPLERKAKPNHPPSPNHRDSDKWHMLPLWGFKIFACRAAIDISLLWSERQNRITLPRRIRVIRDSDKEYLSPRWGFKIFACRPAINMLPLWGCIGSLCSSLYICVNLRPYLQKT